LENTKAWSRIIRSIQSQKANMLFFNGDMVMGYGNGTQLPKTTNVGGVWTPANLPGGLTTDTTDFYSQYGFWRGMVAPLMETGTYVVPVPGNHEVQCKSCGKIATAGNENIWRDNMGDLIIDQSRFSSLLGGPIQNFDVNNHPVVGDPIGTATGDLATIQTDQSQLSYSFDFSGSHFAIINTDAVGNDSHAPVKWLTDDLAAAAARGVAHNFVFGHKPAYTYKYSASVTKPSGFDANPVNQAAFWDLIEQYHATYFSGHEHIFNMMQPRAATGGTAWQVLVGSGGSPFETSVATANPNDRKYAWANVRVFQSGKVEVDAYGFDENFGPTQLLQTVILPQ
jgi:Calcineurin-like phosphoesterase